MPRLKQVTYSSKDVAKTVEFYSSVLGATVIEDAAPAHAKLSFGDFAFYIHQGTPTEEPRLRFQADVDQQLRWLRAFAIPTHEELQGEAGQRWFSVLDPDGRKVVFGESV
jgi:catechol 2,3-dioxygenase-like lactoylglutathione lyase family enzyme